MLGACGAQKVRRISSKLSRFQAKIVKVCRIFRCKKHWQAQKNLRGLRSMHKMIVRAFCRRSAGVCGCDRADLQHFQRKTRAFKISTEKLRKFGVKRARLTQGTSAESANMRRTLCGKLLPRLRIFGRRSARVECKKCVEFHRNFRDLTRKS